MEEKLLKALEDNVKNLNENKKQVEEAINEETKNSQMILRDGKYDKSLQYYKYKGDMTKIEEELKKVAKDKERVFEKKEKEKEIKEEKEKIKELKKRKEECEQAIAEESKYYSSKGKSSVLIEYEKDLDKINNEMNTRMINVLRGEKELRTLKIFIDNLAKKYNIKEEKDKTEKESKDKQTKEQKDETSKVVKEESQEKTQRKENKFASKAEDKDDISEKIRKVQEEMKAEDRNYGAIHFDTEPEINNVNFNNVKNKKKENTKSGASYTDVKVERDNQDNSRTTAKTTAPDENNISANSTSENDKDEEKDFEIKIEVGRTGKITFNGKEYKVGTNVIRKGLNLSEDKVIDILKDKLEFESSKVEDSIRKGIKQKIIDSSVIKTIVSSRMGKEDKYQVLSEYVANAINAEVGKEYKNNCNVTYNKDDLSEASFLNRIFRREINAKQKVEMLNRALVGERYNIAESTGEYKIDKVSEFMSRLTGNKVPLLEDKINSQWKVAEVYNELLDENKVTDKEKFMRGLKANIKGARLSEEQLDEINELRESQVSQKEEER